MATYATPVKDAVAITCHGEFPDRSAKYLEADCGSYEVFSAMPNAVTLNGDTYGKSSWTSDRNRVVYRTDRVVAIKR